MKIKQTLLIILLTWGGQACIGQSITPDVIASAGGSSSNSNLSLSWTLGEPIITTEGGGAYFLTQGFQQPPAIIVTAINNPTAQSNISVYPSPATSSVYIKKSGNEQLQLQLIDLNGKMILNKTLPPSENQLDLSDVADGMYFLKVFDVDNKFIQSLKIEKIK